MAARTLKPGTELAGGRYWIESEVGRGAAAVVYRALDERHDRIVAVKVIDSEIASGVTAERFLSEIQVVARLTHPHILPVHDSGVSDNQLYCVMPFVAGRTLREHMDRAGPLPLSDALRIIRQVASALDYAHREGVLHRDVKPENILLADGQAVLSDFGLSCALGGPDAQRLTVSGMVVGTPLYMSPEQATGERALDGRADQYSLACVCYEMLTGKPPFTGTTLPAVLSAHILQSIPRLREVRPEVPQSIENALVRALAKTPEERFDDVAAFSAALEGTADPALGSRHRLLTAGAAAGNGTRGVLSLMVAELKRRGVLRTASVYVVGAWVLMQASDLVTSAFGLSQRWVALIIVAAIIGLPIVILLSWLYRFGVGAQRERAPAGVGRAGLQLQTAVGLAILGGVALVALGGWMTLRYSRTDATLPSLDRIAVLYFTDDTPIRESMLGPALTNALIAHLSRAKGLSVIPSSGVAQFRDQAVPPDSIARALGVDLLVNGSVLQSTDSVRVLVDVIDARTLATVEQLQVTRSATNPIALVDAVTDDVADWLLEHLGREQRLRAWRAGTDNPEAWRLLQRGIEREELSSRLLALGDPAAAAAELAAADSLLAGAERLDEAYHDAAVQRGWVAYGNAFIAGLLGRDSVAARYALAGEAHAGRVLQSDRRHAGAWEVRGVLREFRYAFAEPSDPSAARDLLRAAELDLERAIELESSRARALHALSSVREARGAFAESLVLLEQAYRADAYQHDAPIIAERLFTTNFELGRDSVAEVWCQELKRRGTPMLAGACELQLAAWSAQRTPDVAAAWQIPEAQLRVAPEAQRADVRAHLQILVAGVIARAGMPDSARAVLERIDVPISAQDDLLQLEAGVRVLLGEHDRAVALLGEYARRRQGEHFANLLARSRRFEPLAVNPLAPAKPTD